MDSILFTKYQSKESWTLLLGLRTVQHTILDVQSPHWHDEYPRFKKGTKELEVMVQNTINSIFTTVTTVQEGVEILEVFSDMATREVSSSYLHPAASQGCLLEGVGKLITVEPL